LKTQLFFELILTEENKVEQLAGARSMWILAQVSYSSEMLDVIHMDKKWFNMTELTKPCSLVDDKEDL